jgi:hypothetical protein
VNEQIATDKFHFDGRGPELKRAVWDERGTTLLAVDYADTEGAVRHARFHGSQVAMFTPEEVIGSSGHRGAVDLGQSEWLHSFHQEHLGRCRHFRLLFYDELLDVICESVEFADGAFTSAA